jgi:hypothetical protein
MKIRIIGIIVMVSSLGFVLVGWPLIANLARAPQAVPRVAVQASQACSDAVGRWAHEGIARAERNEERAVNDPLEQEMRRACDPA